MTAHTQTAVAVPESFVYEPDRKAVFRLTWISLLYLYVLQYPLTLLLPEKGVPVLWAKSEYSYAEWVIAYAFVSVSAAIFLGSLYGGMLGRPVTISPMHRRPMWTPRKPVAPRIVIVMFLAFFAWSYLMLKLHIGMTFFADFDPLPFKITGILFYGRLLIQPLVLAYVAESYSGSRLRWVVAAMLATLGAWASLTSGSRFVGIVFAAPFLLMFRGKARYAVFAIAALAFIVIASASRTLYLPYELGGEYLTIYGNEELQESTTEDMPMEAADYLVRRPMGMGEVLLTLDYGAITDDIKDSAATFLSSFLPFVKPGNTASIKNIYGLADDAFGGFGLDIFSNFWVQLGGSPVLYGIGVGLIGWMLGKTYRLFAISLTRFGFERGATLMYLLLLILVSEARIFLFPVFLLLGWMLSRASTYRFVIETFVPKRA